MLAASVRQPACRPDSELKIPHRHFEDGCEISQHGHGLSKLVTRDRLQARRVKDAAKRRSEKLRQRAAFGRLDLDRLEVALIGDGKKAIEQHCLADAPKSEQHHALGRAFGERSLHVDRGGLDHFVPVGESRGGLRPAPGE